ncbi:MAG TPA: UDP-N-acetylmuramoyl-tripeptide--D-alanyl-D-alanine ligase [Vicinamibacterales bacterium]|nr:UDP-N-acetylmuramoyl-tripeptide--D-alanyl-D-alanine ligase [Vicinamibacterales bacterium]
MNELELTLGWVAKTVGGTLQSGDPALPVGDVLTDSRSLRAGDLFVALKGPRFDGHSFIEEVLERGAAGAIVEGGDSRRAGPGVWTHHGAVIEVADTLRALQDLAHGVRLAAETRVIAITGSAGKTTTKETIAEMLATRHRVVKNKGNLNNHIGLPLSLMQLRTRPDVAVMELGMNHAGEISRLVEIAEPDVRVWTNVGDAHLGFFASPDAIADAKGEILQRATAATLLVCNADDWRVMARARAFAGRTITFGTVENADVHAASIDDRGVDGMRARVTTPSGERSFETPLLGRGNLANVLAATAVALDAGIALDTIVDVAARLRPADRRGAVARLGGGITLIDDSYNSSPSALRRALEVVAHENRCERKIAVLGEMLELGDHAQALHEECGRAAAAAGLTMLFAIGGAPARALADAAVAAGMPRESVVYFAQSAEAIAPVSAQVRRGDLVLVKGSRGTRTDLVADRLAAEFA